MICNFSLGRWTWGEQWSGARRVRQQFLRYQCVDKNSQMVGDRFMKAAPWHNAWVFRLKETFTRAPGSWAGSFWMLLLLSLLQRTDPNVNLSSQIKQDWEFLLGFVSLFNHVLHVAQGFPFFKPLIFTWTWNRIRDLGLPVYKCLDKV